MKYYYQSNINHETDYFQLYRYDHPLFDLCTLYLQDGRGLIVIQAVYDPGNKSINWGPVERNLANDIFVHPDFRIYFLEHSDFGINGYYPIVSVRKIMWALRMKPLKREDWEQELQFFI